MLLNSKGEYNRCEIARLVLGEDEGGVDQAERQAVQEQEIKQWVEDKIGKKRQKKKSNLAKVKSVVRKRGAVLEVEKNKDDLKITEEDDLPKKKRIKSYNHPIIPQGWGTKVVHHKEELRFNPQPQRVGCRLRGSRVVGTAILPW